MSWFITNKFLPHSHKTFRKPKSQVACFCLLFTSGPRAFPHNLAFAFLDMPCLYCITSPLINLLNPKGVQAPSIALMNLFSIILARLPPNSHVSCIGQRDLPHKTSTVQVGSPKSRRKEQKQLISVCDNGGRDQNIWKFSWRHMWIVPDKSAERERESSFSNFWFSALLYPLGYLPSEPSLSRPQFDKLPPNCVSPSLFYTAGGISNLALPVDFRFYLSFKPKQEWDTCVCQEEC